MRTLVAVVFRRSRHQARAGSPVAARDTAWWGRGTALMRLADNLDVPLRDRDRLLLAAGYAPRYQDHQLDDVSIAVVMDGLRRLLDAHLPYPALLLDGHWDIVDANAAVDELLAGCAPELLEPPVNVIRAGPFHAPGGPAELRHHETPRFVPSSFFLIFRSSPEIRDKWFGGRSTA